MSKPTSLKRKNAIVLSSTWSDGFESSILLSDLREVCPCAHCTGEEIMGEVVFAGMKTLAPGMNELTQLTPVGNYGVQASWNDGHNSGIYTWQMLRDVFEQKKLSQKTLDEIEGQTGG